jgi:hypothetical protein
MSIIDEIKKSASEKHSRNPRDCRSMEIGWRLLQGPSMIYKILSISFPDHWNELDKAFNNCFVDFGKEIPYIIPWARATADWLNFDPRSKALTIYITQTFPGNKHRPSSTREGIAKLFLSPLPPTLCKVNNKLLTLRMWKRILRENKIPTFTHNHNTDGWRPSQVSDWIPSGQIKTFQSDNLFNLAI